MPLFVTSFLQFYEVPPQSNSTDSAEDVNISLDPLPIILKLIFIVLVPLAVGKALRFFDFVCRFVKRHKVGLKLASSFLLAMVPWMKGAVPILKCRRLWSCLTTFFKHASVFKR